MMYSMALTSWFVTDSISLTRWASAVEKSVYSERRAANFERVDPGKLRQRQFAEGDEILDFDADAVADEGLFRKNNRPVSPFYYGNARRRAKWR
ncbi:MAG: hypothetical protein ACLUNS_09170 [Alistipes shahii]